MLSEKELEERRKEFRENEIQNKIASYKQVSATEYRTNVIKTNYTFKKVDKRIGPFSWTLIIAQAVFLIFFSSLYVLSYIPKTKVIVSKIMP